MEQNNMLLMEMNLPLWHMSIVNILQESKKRKKKKEKRKEADPA